MRWLMVLATLLSTVALAANPQVSLDTSKGEIVLELYPDRAPATVANFLSYVQDGFYNGTVFHRIIPNFMAQGGCPDGTGRGGPGYHIPCECYQANARKHERGTLSMAHAGRNTGGSQFFLTFIKTDWLDGRHTVFGKVVKGMENVDKLQRIDPSKPQAGVKPDKIVEATVIRKRDHDYTPKKAN